MTPITPTTSDLLASLQSRQRVANVKIDVETANAEVATGRHSDLPKALNGDLNALASVERGLELTQVRRDVLSELSARHTQAQTVLERMSGLAEDTAADLLTDSLSPGRLDDAPERTRTAFTDLTALLNSRSAGRFLFAGTASDTAPVSDGPAVLASLAADLAAAPPGTDRSSFVRDWFMDPAGGFETAHLFANAPGRVPVDDEGSSVPAGPPAASAPEFRALLANLAEVALSGDLPMEDRAASVARAAEGMMTEVPDLIALRAEVGVAEERLAEAETANAARYAALSQLRNDMLQVDPYEAATRLAETTALLERVFAATAKLSRLSLVEYLR